MPARSDEAEREEEPEEPDQVYNLNTMAETSFSEALVIVRRPPPLRRATAEREEAAEQSDNEPAQRVGERAPESFIASRRRQSSADSIPAERAKRARIPSMASVVSMASDASGGILNRAFAATTDESPANTQSAASDAGGEHPAGTAPDGDNEGNASNASNASNEGFDDKPSIADNEGNANNANNASNGDNASNAADEAVASNASNASKASNASTGSKAHHEDNRDEMAPSRGAITRARGAITTHEPTGESVDAGSAVGTATSEAPEERSHPVSLPQHSVVVHQRLFESFLEDSVRETTRHVHPLFLSTILFGYIRNL